MLFQPCPWPGFCRLKACASTCAQVLKALRLGTSVGSSSGSDNGSPRGGQDVADGILDTAYSIESSRPMLERRGSELFRITEHTSTEEQQQ